MLVQQTVLRVRGLNYQLIQGSWSTMYSSTSVEDLDGQQKLRSLRPLAQQWSPGTLSLRLSEISIENDFETDQNQGTINLLLYNPIYSNQ